MGQPAARVGDMTSHGTPLGPGPGCPTVMIMGMLAWRAASDTHACPLVDVLKPHVGGVVAMDSTTVERIRQVVTDALRRYEARIEVLGVTVEEDPDLVGQLLIELEYRVRRTNQLGNMVFPFYFREGGAP